MFIVNKIPKFSLLQNGKKEKKETKKNDRKAPISAASSTIIQYREGYATGTSICSDQHYSTCCCARYR